MGEEEKMLDVDGRPVVSGKCNHEWIQSLEEYFNALPDDIVEGAKQILGHYLVQKCIDEFVNIEEKEPNHTETEKEGLTLEAGGKPVGIGKCSIEISKSLAEELAESVGEAVKSAHDIFTELVKRRNINLDGVETGIHKTFTEMEVIPRGAAFDMYNYELGDLVVKGKYSWVCADCGITIRLPLSLYSSWQYWIYLYWDGRTSMPKDFKQYAYSNFGRIIKEMIYHKKRMELAKSEGFKRHHEKRLKSLENTYKFSLIWNGNEN